MESELSSGGASSVAMSFSGSPGTSPAEGENWGLYLLWIISKREKSNVMREKRLVMRYITGTFQWAAIEECHSWTCTQDENLPLLSSIGDPPPISSNRSSFLEFPLLR